MRRVAAAPPAELAQLDSVRRVAPRLIRLIVAPLAVFASQRHRDADISASHLLPRCVAVRTPLQEKTSGRGARQIRRIARRDFPLRPPSEWANRSPIRSSALSHQQTGKADYEGDEQAAAELEKGSLGESKRALASARGHRPRHSFRRVEHGLSGHTECADSATALKAESLGDDFALDLAGATVDGGDQRGADVPLHVVLGGVAVAAHHLHAFQSDLLRSLGGLQLGH
jgi:hypothetical protein